MTGQRPLPPTFLSAAYWSSATRYRGRRRVGRRSRHSVCADRRIAAAAIPPRDGPRSVTRRGGGPERVDGEIADTPPCSTTAPGSFSGSPASQGRRLHAVSRPGGHCCQCRRIPVVTIARRWYTGEDGALRDTPKHCGADDAIVVSWWRLLRFGHLVLLCGRVRRAGRRPRRCQISSAGSDPPPLWSHSLYPPSF